MKKFFTLFSVAFLAMSAFAQTYDGGTWYSVFASKEITNVVTGTKIDEWDVFAPATGTVTFDYKKLAALTVNGKIKVQTSENGSNYSDIGSVSYSDYKNYKSGSVSDIPANIKKMKFVNTSTGSQTKNVKLPLAKHILLSGGDFGKSSVSKTFTQETRIGESSNIRADFRSFLTNGNISISLTEGDAEVFRLGAENNTTGVLSSSTAGKTYAVGANACASANGSAAACSAGQLGKIDNYSFQIYFCPKAVGEATGKITITDDTNTATISLKGTGIKMETLEVDVPLSFCQGSSVEYRGKTYTAATSEQINATGAIRDTVYNVTVTVLQPTTGTAEKTIVYGAEESWNGIDLSEYTVGSHEVEFKTTNVAGCDSTVTLTLTVNKQETLEVPVELSFCAGGSEYYRGVEYTEAGAFNVPAEGATRDTVYMVNVTVLQPSSEAVEMEMTVGDDLEWNGIALKDSTVGVHSVVAVLTNAAGCDSTVMLMLTVNKIETLEVPVDLAFCAGGSEWYRGTEYAEVGVYDVPVEGAVRDTLYKVNVIVLQPTTGTAEKTIVYGAEESWNGIDLSEYTVGSHEVEFKTTNVAGCDSTVTLTLTVNKQETLEVPVELSFCAGGSEYYRGVEYTEAGVFDVPAEGAVRDTLYKVNVIVLQPTTGTAEKTIVYGAEESWNGIDLSEYTVGSHEVEFKTTNVAGCDSTVTLTLTVNKQETLEVPVELSFCAGGSEEFRGVEYKEAGVFDVPAEGAVRDTLYKVNVIVLQPTTGTAEKTIVYGAEESWNGIDLSEYTVGSHEVEFKTTNVAGCDSTVTLTLTVNKQETLEVPVELSFCAGGSEEFRGIEYKEAGLYDVPTEGAVRDTLYKVNVIVLQPSFGNAEMEITVGDEVEWNGIALKDSTVGVHYVVFDTTNVAGCDSTVTLTLTVNKMDTLKTEYEIEICEGSEQTYRGVIYNEEGRFTLDVIEGETRDTLLTVVVTVNAKGYEEILLTDTIGNVIELPEGEWTLGEEVVSGSYEIQDTDIEGLVFVQIGETEKGCEDVTKIIVTVEEKPQDQGDPTGFENVGETQKAVKEFRNGVLYIRRGEKVYTASGELVK